MSNKNDTKKNKKKSFPLHIIAINLSITIIIGACAIYANHFIYKKRIDSNLSKVQQVTDFSLEAIGIETLRSLKNNRKQMGLSYIENADIKIKNQLTKIYKDNKLASPPVIYARSKRHHDFMYILSSGHLQSNPMDVYKMSGPVMDAYLHRESTSTLKEHRQSGLARATILSTTPFADKKGNVYGVLIMEFDIHREMQNMASLTTTIYTAGGILYVALLSLFNFLMKKDKPQPLSQSHLKPQNSEKAS